MTGGSPYFRKPPFSAEQNWGYESLLMSTPGWRNHGLLTRGYSPIMCTHSIAYYHLLPLVGGVYFVFLCFSIYWVSSHPNRLSHFSEGWLNDQPANLGTTGLTPNFWQTHLIGDMCIQPMPMLKADLGCSYHLSISYYVGFLIFILCWFWSWNIIFI